jgi:hypothetical protein
MGGSSSTSNCSQGFISWCESVYNTSNCTLCSADVSATGVDVFGDYLDSSNIKFIKGKTFTAVPLNSPYHIIKGILYIDNPSSASTAKLLQDGGLFTVISEGTFYSTGILNTLILFRKNIQPFVKSINIFTSLASSKIIETGNPDINIINTLMAKKLGFTVKDYNYYLNNIYYDYNKDKSNKYALELIRVSANIIFIWHLIYKRAVELNIKIDYSFYITFYLSIFDNLDRTKPILSYQINPYFIKYCPNGILSNLDDVCIKKWFKIISVEVNLTNILILKMASHLLSQDELISNDSSAINLKLSPSSVESRLNECFSYRESIHNKYLFSNNN